MIHVVSLLSYQIFLFLLQTAVIATGTKSPYTVTVFVHSLKAIDWLTGFIVSLLYILLLCKGPYCNGVCLPT